MESSICVAVITFLPAAVVSLMILLLDDRNLFHRDLNTHIATGYHDTVGNFDDLFQVLNTLQALDLGDDLDLGVVLL